MGSCPLLRRTAGRIAARFVDGDAAALMQGQTLLAFGWDVNQVAANFSVVVISCAIALWSADFARDRGAPRALGIGGVIVALACVASLALGMRLDVQGMLLVVIGWTAWQVAIGVWLLRGAK